MPGRLEVLAVPRLCARHRAAAELGPPPLRRCTAGPAAGALPAVDVLCDNGLGPAAGRPKPPLREALLDFVNDATCMREPNTS